MKEKCSVSLNNRNHRSQWSTGELSYLEAQYGKIPTLAVATYLGRSVSAIHSAARLLGLTRATQVWTEAEKDILRTHYARGKGITYVMSLLPGRTRQTIFTMAKALGINSARHWAAHELDTLRKYYPSLGTRTVERLPGRSAEAVRVKASQLSLRFHGINGYNVKQRMWTDAEWQRLAKNGHLPLIELMKLFPDRTLLSIKKAKERQRKQKRNSDAHTKGLNI